MVFEDPTYLVDIPGSNDRFYQKFIEENPKVNYPKERKETPEYLMVQQAKAETLVEFFRELAAHAKSVGAKKVGVMPWFFTPTILNTPDVTHNPSCNINMIARIPEVDFLVSRMRPDDIYADKMRAGDDLSKSPKLHYIELLAHALGKDVVSLASPVNNHVAGDKKPLLPADFFRTDSMAALAAAPGGYTLEQYPECCEGDTTATEFLSKTMKLASRLGQPRSPVAFVFSYSGTRHAEPLTYETVFSHYLALAKYMASKAHIPMLTFHAETLERELEDHPEVQVLVFEEHFPLTAEQMLVIRKWWQGMEKRAAICTWIRLGLLRGPEVARHSTHIQGASRHT